MALRQYEGGAKPTTVDGDFSAAATSFTVADATGWPDGSVGPFTIVVNRTGATAEKMLATARTGTTPATITVPLVNRGYDDTTAAAHFAGEIVEHVATAEDMRDANAHVFDTTRDDHTQYLRKALVDTKGDLLVATAADVVDRLGVGADNTVLEADSSTSKGVRWGTQPVKYTAFDAPGDLLVGTGDNIASRRAVGTDGHVLTADSTDLYGVVWAPPADDHALGELDYAEATTDTPGITATAVGVLSRTVSIAAGRRTRLTGLGRILSSVADTAFAMFLDVDGVTVQYAERTCRLTTAAETMETSIVLSLSAGAHTFALTFARLTGPGTGTNVAAANAPTYLQVEDVGV